MSPTSSPKVVWLIQKQPTKYSTWLKKLLFSNLYQIWELSCLLYKNITLNLIKLREATKKRSRRNKKVNKQEEIKGYLMFSTTCTIKLIYLSTMQFLTVVWASKIGGSSTQTIRELVPSGQLLATTLDSEIAILKIFSWLRTANLSISIFNTPLI